MPHGTPCLTRSPNNDVDFLKIRTSVRREKIQIMEEAYASISSRGTVDRTQDVDPFKDIFKHQGIVVKVFAVSTKTAHLIACQ